MIYDIVISDQAETDLREIFEYIAFELQAPENASGQLDRLEASIRNLMGWLRASARERRFTGLALFF